MRVKYLTLSTKDWGDIQIMTPIPIKGDKWGDLAPLRGTVYERLIKSVDAEAYSNAVRKYGTPLMRVIGMSPEGCIKRLPAQFKRCLNAGACATETPACVLGHPKLPDCYEAPLEGEAAEAATLVSLAWRDGRYVILIDGEEFV